MIDLDTLSQKLARQFGDDAAQHALLRVVEKGWHLDPGENKVEHFAKVCAAHYRITEGRKGGREIPTDHQANLPLPTAPTALRVAQAREELASLPPIVVEQAFWGYEDTALHHGVKPGTVKSRVSRVMGRST